MPTLLEVRVRVHGNVEKRLFELRDELRQLRESLHVLDEQVTYLEEVADDAETRALVSGTPLADRERHQAAEDLRRARQQRDDLAVRIGELTVEQDDLLERLLQ